MPLDRGTSGPAPKLTSQKEAENAEEERNHSEMDALAAGVAQATLTGGEVPSTALTASSAPVVTPPTLQHAATAPPKATAAVPSAEIAVVPAADAEAAAPEPVDPMDTDLHSFHSLVHFNPQVPGFTKVKTLGDAIHGKVYRMTTKTPLSSGSASSGDALEAGRPGLVVVKKMANDKVDQSRRFQRNDREAHRSRNGCLEDALNEIGVLAYLQNRPEHRRYVLRLLGIYRDNDYTYLCTENCDEELFNVAAGQTRLDQAFVKKAMWQLLQAVRYLHFHNVGHRDISLENLLMVNGPPDQRDAWEVRLMDFGQAVRVHAEDKRRTPLRYFRAAGKAYYRPPEAYVPEVPQLQVCCPDGYTEDSIVQVQTTSGHWCEVRFKPRATPGSVCIAEPVGYEVAPMDMFACGVCLFVLDTQNPPWRMAVNADSLFKYIQQHGLQALYQAWRKPLLPPEAMELMTGLLQAVATRRWTLQQALDSPWFSDFPAFD